MRIEDSRFGAGHGIHVQGTGIDKSGIAFVQKDFLVRRSQLNRSLCNDNNLSGDMPVPGHHLLRIFFHFGFHAGIRKPLGGEGNALVIVLVCMK